ncbi:hypothetical protein B0T26DRAFT_737723 [Lasiosphaeria miniovina]|uniref:Meiotically up-regulated protein n=1 Tax=Lasiosphaeria miniovina TaxID=1954250 RepID=A0AA40E4J2_9PEZI|nr:uncharacterized protein B0T26DRAFT_737723 [Lasiosphaeria miniovina]KAK0726830.1 hypothetical protein B0T26DRAFT_737723 [Lasiosphaeria miniovina]
MDDVEERGPRKAHGGPYTSKHPVPTVQGYREHRAELKERQQETEDLQNQQDQDDAAGQRAAAGDAGDSRAKRAYESVKAIAKNKDRQAAVHDPYPTANRNQISGPPGDDSESGAVQGGHDPRQEDVEGSESDNDGSRDQPDSKDKSATETVAASIDPKEKRKAMKKTKRGGGGREVTDPVTHLPMVIHDMTNKDLGAVPENEATVGETPHTLTGLGGASKSQQQLGKEKAGIDSGHQGMRMMFPPPEFEDTKREMASTYRTALVAGLASVSSLALLAIGFITLLQSSSSHHSAGGYRSWWLWPSVLAVLGLAGAGSFGIVVAISGWLDKRVEDVFEDEIWDAARMRETERNGSGTELPESAAWLNSMLMSMWPLINPDLFASLVDTLEDVMQASLPKVVRMVSVDDLGQGSEAIRILGVKWLPTGAAGQSVDSQGNRKASKSSKSNDRAAPGEGEIDNGDDGKQQKGDGGDEGEGDGKDRSQDAEAIREGMEAEEGDFVNMELAFSYRARSSGKSMKSKAKNAHLYLKFYLPGGIAVPVWVELRGIVGIMRLRLQLTPDPPFIDLCTLTFLGQPRADISCVPLSKHSLNLMDVPLISTFVQSSIDAALAEYVAPKSLTLALKEMLVGDDFKKDTVARGVVLVHIKRARDFKDGDGGFGPMKGSSDSYVTASWGKFGKPQACTRIIVDDQKPNWDEWASILVSPDEINADETLRLQIWDSDKHTADDDLGRVELRLKEIMHDSKTKNQMCDREDELRAEDPDEKMPGKIMWSVGYFAKAHIQQTQLDQQTVDPSIRSLDTLKKQVSETARSKLREALDSKDTSKELHQQEVQDCKEMEDAMIISAPPLDDLPSGILSIQIHNMTGLEVAKPNRSRTNGAGDGEDREDEAEQSDDLPDSYCTIILNHTKVYRTRTKPKNAKPFFNAGTERFVKDWRTAEVIVSVRDSREGENDPLLGIVYLPLRRVFKKRSQTMATYPLAGGIGYGRARVSMVWRSVELKMPRELMGWDYGTIEVKAPVKITSADFPEQLRQCKLKFKTKINKAKMHTVQDDGGSSGGGAWRPKKQTEEGVFLGVIKRYAAPLVIEFRHKSVLADGSPGLAVLWLGSIPDEEEWTVTLQVWKGGKKQLQRARACANYNGLDDGEKPLGEMELTVRFWRGLSGFHKAYSHRSRNADVRGVMEVLDTVNDEKMAEGEGEAEVDDQGAKDSHGEVGASKDDSFSGLGFDSDSGSDTDSSSSESDEDGDGLGKKQESREEAEKRKMLRKAGDSSSSSSSSGGESDPEGGGSGRSKSLAKPVKKLPAKLKQQTSPLLNWKGGSDDDGTRGVVSQMQDYKRHHKQLHRQHKGVMQWKAARTLDWMADKVNEGKGKAVDAFHHSDKGQGIETEV